jgi:hypothetical protein
MASAPPGAADAGSSLLRLEAQSIRRNGEESCLLCNHSLPARVSLSPSVFQTRSRQIADAFFELFAV